MIKHVILVGNGGGYANGVTDHGVEEFYEDGGTAILISDNETNGSNYTKDITFKHKGMVTVFPMPPRRKDYLSVTCYPLANLLNNGRVRTNIVFEANSSFNLPNVQITNGIISSTTVDTEGAIIPGIYGFMLVKKNVNFNKRNKWYIELIIKENTSYSDFCTLLNAKFKEIDSDLTLTNSTNTFTLKTAAAVDKAYELMFDDLSSFAFTKVSSTGINNRGKHFIRKICREADANYGFDYPLNEGVELYKNRTDEMYNELLEIAKSDTCDSVVLNLKYNEPSYYRTVDEKINKVLTIIGNWATINFILTALQLTLDNDFDASSLQGTVPGDVNNDGVVDVEDVNAMINIILGHAQASDYEGVADINGDGKVDVEDVNAAINIILHRTSGTNSETPQKKVSQLSSELGNAAGDIVAYLANKYDKTPALSQSSYSGVPEAMEALHQ